MTLNNRRWLLGIFIILFISIGISITFYSNGWRFDLETFTISKLGAIFFENIPTDVSINIEKTNIKFTPGFLKSNLLIANLFPKIYPITISKSGYQSWHKEIPVKPSLVTEVPPIILLQEKFAISSTTAKEKRDFQTRDKNLTALKKAAISKFNSEELPLLKENFGRIRYAEYSPSQNFISVLNSQNKLYLINKNSLKSKLISENALISSFSPDSKKIAFITEKKEIVIYNLTTQETTILNIGVSEDSSFTWHKNSEYLFIKYSSNLYLLEGNNLPPINLQLINSGIEKYQYLPEKNSVYLLKENSLYNLELQ